MGLKLGGMMHSTMKQITIPWWHHQMETFSALLAICAGNSPVSGESPTQRPVTRCFDVFFDLRLNKRLSKQSWGWWFETSSCPIWRHNNVKWLCYANFCAFHRTLKFSKIGMAQVWGMMTHIRKREGITSWRGNRWHDAMYHEADH